MLRISKLTDYAVVLAVHMASRDPGASYAVSDLSAETGIPQPTVSKVVKQLSKDGLLLSQRGAHGGYRLSRAPARINIAEIIVSLEGPIAMTECSLPPRNGAHACEREASCDTRTPWRRINEALLRTLEGITLEDMARDASQKLVELRVVSG